MRLIKTTTNRVLLFVILISVFNLSHTLAFVNVELKNTKIKDSTISALIFTAQNYYKEKEYKKASTYYESILSIGVEDSLSIYKQLSFSYAKSNKTILASKYIEKYVLATFDLDFVSHSYFNNIKNSESYKKLANKYLKKIDIWSIFCVNVGFIGFFIAIVLNLRKRSDKVANFLMSAFVFLHSIFILNISLLLTNYWYDVPHTMYSTTIFSFLYGPLIYFYFKRVTVNYKFVAKDLLHLIPTVVLIIVLLPIYGLSAEEKLKMIVLKEGPYIAEISSAKLISLLVYGVLVVQLYLKFIRNNKTISRGVFIWQRNIVVFCSIYIISYLIYMVLINQKIYSGFWYNLQIVAMAILVLYVSYTAFVQPSIFGKLRVLKVNTNDNSSKVKYKKSGLTPSFSIELKDKLIYILNEEKVYKQNNITLQKLSELLDTTRHNTSQIINEHFGLNFFELINKYRIEEAKQLLVEIDKQKSLSIIDVAYEVGFNNKVTFNKSFKKYNQITPTEYIKSFVA